MKARGAALAMLAAALVLTAFGCKQKRGGIVLVYAGDGGTACASATNLRCVNYLNFQLTGTGEDDFVIHCVKAPTGLDSMCRLREAGDGTTEVFRRDPDDRVDIEVTGLRVFPAISCQENPDCKHKKIFYGKVRGVRVGDIADRGVELPVTPACPGCEPCVLETYWTQLSDDDACTRTCDKAGGVPVSECTIPGICLCQHESLDGGPSDVRVSSHEDALGPLEDGPVYAGD
jgi:hypothetical protein